MGDGEVKAFGRPGNERGIPCFLRDSCFYPPNGRKCEIAPRGEGEGLEGFEVGHEIEIASQHNGVGSMR